MPRTSKAIKQAEDLAKIIGGVAKHIKQGISGKIKDEEHQAFIEETLNGLSHLLRNCEQVGSRPSFINKAEKQIDLLEKKFPKNYFKRKAPVETEDFEDDFEEGFDEEIERNGGYDDEYEDDEYIKENKNPREKPFNFSSSKKEKIVKECISAMGEENLNSNAEATRFVYDWLEENNYVKRGVSAPIGVLGPLFRYIDENYEE